VRSCLHIQVGLLTAAHALEEVADMRLHHVSLLNRYLDFFLAEFVIRERMALLLHLSADQLRAHKNVWRAGVRTSPCSTMMIVPSCPRMRPGMCWLFAMDELRTSECPSGYSAKTWKVSGTSRSFVNTYLPPDAITFDGNCGLSQQIFSGATTWKNKSVAMPPE
jgi:hypothetical protein